MCSLFCILKPLLLLLLLFLLLLCILCMVYRLQNAVFGLLSFYIVRFDPFYSFSSVVHTLGPWLCHYFVISQDVRSVYIFVYIYIYMILRRDIFSLRLMYKLHFVLIVQICLSRGFGTRRFPLLKLYIYIYYVYTCINVYYYYSRPE